MMGRFATTLALAVVLAVPAGAETLFSSSNGRSNFENALKLLDGRASEQYSGSARYRPRPDDTVPTYRGKYRGEFLAVAKAAAARHGVPADLFLRLVQQESGWKVDAISVKGAIGLAQLMPDTALRLGVDPEDPEQNLDGGARYLAEQFKRFKSWRLALAAYNAGPEAVVEYDGIPPYAETEGYVKAIMGG